MKRYIKEYLPYAVLIILIILVKVFVMTPVRVRGVSMNNTLKDKDIMLLDKISYRFNEIKRFDIVVIRWSDEEIIKRVIGLPGDEIQYKDNKLYVNGRLVEENFKKIEAAELEEYNTLTIGNKKVPKDCYFVLGDNRPRSADSRIIGFVKKKDIVGKAVFTIFPFNRWGAKN